MSHLWSRLDAYPAPRRRGAEAALLPGEAAAVAAAAPPVPATRIWTFAIMDSGGAGSSNYHVVSPEYNGPGIVTLISANWSGLGGGAGGIPGLILFESDDNALPGAKTATTVFPSGQRVWDQSFNSSVAIAAPPQPTMTDARGRSFSEVSLRAPLRYVIRRHPFFLKLTFHSPILLAGDMHGYIQLYEGVAEESLLALLNA